MPRGRPRKPRAVKELQGTLRKHREPKCVARAPEGRPACPAHLGGIGRAKWRELVPLLEQMGLLTRADRGALEALCGAYEVWRGAHAVVLKQGLTYQATTAAGAVLFRARPEVAIGADAWRRYLGGLVQFGLTPAARGKVEADPAAFPPDVGGETAPASGAPGGEDGLGALFTLRGA